MKVLALVWAVWKAFATKVGDVQARVILAIFYFAILSPLALGVRWWADPLGIKPRTPKGWRPLGVSQGSLERARLQH